MLLEFKTKNYKSFVEEASFSMVAAPKQKGLDYSLMKTKIKGKEMPASNAYYENYCERFENECAYSLGSNEYGVPFYQLPENSRYIKSEDILYEVKKIQQKQVLSDGTLYDYIKRGMKKEDAEKYLQSKEGSKQMEYIMYAQEKYSNGETSMQYFDEFLQPGALYLLDEPEVSLSPANQVALAEEINKMARKAIEKTILEHGMKYQEVITWSTDGFFRETKEKVAYRKAEGCSVVEMECSALAACAAFRDATWGMILYTADSLAEVDRYDERNWGGNAYEYALTLCMDSVLAV